MRVIDLLILFLTFGNVLAQTTDYYLGAAAQPVTGAVFYVDTASTAGGDGTTAATAGAHRAFASFAEALDAQPGTLILPTTFYMAASTGVGDTATTTQAHWDFNTDAVNYLRIVGNNSTGKWNTNAYWMNISNSAAIYNNNASHVRIENFQIQITTSTSIGNNYNCFRLTTANNATANIDHRFINCIAKGIVVGGATDGVFGYINSDPVTFTGTTKMANCIAYNCNRGFNTDATAYSISSIFFYNCTSVSNTFGFEDCSNTKNCLAFGIADGQAWIGTKGGGENNVSSESSAPGVNARINQTITFVGGEDFHLSASDAGARNFGKTDPSGGFYLTDIDGTTRTGAWDVGADQADDGLIEQEGYRFRDDDGSESAATWLASQDSNVTRATATNTRLRALLNATGNPPSQQYQLEFKKSSDTTYKRVEVAGGGAITYGAVGTVTTTGTTAPTVDYPTGITYDDILLMAVVNRPSTSTPATPDGWTAPANNTVTGGAGAEGAGTGLIRTTVFYKIATGTESGTETLNITSGTSAGAAIWRVARTTGKDWGIALASGSDNSAGSSWSVTFGSDPGVTAGDLVFVASGSSEDTATLATEAMTQTGVTFGTVTERVDTAIATGNDIRLAITQHAITSGTSSAAAVYTMTASGTGNGNVAGSSVMIRLRQSDSAMQLAASANIGASGANTTVQMTAPSGKSTSDFVVGRIQDDENPADAIDITVDDYTELEWSVKATATAASSDVYQFRTTISGFPIDTYTLTPQWTIP